MKEMNNETNQGEGIINEPSRCLQLTNIPENIESYCFDSNSYKCLLTGNPCVGREEEEVSFQPSHYCPETVYDYKDAKAKKICPVHSATLGNDKSKLISQICSSDISLIVSDHMQIDRVNKTLVDVLLQSSPEKVAIIIEKDHEVQKYKTSIYAG
jgi:hypothetical protein